MGKDLFHAGKLVSALAKTADQGASPRQKTDLPRVACEFSIARNGDQQPCFAFGASALGLGGALRNDDQSQGNVLAVYTKIGVAQNAVSNRQMQVIGQRFGAFALPKEGCVCDQIGDLHHAVKDGLSTLSVEKNAVSLLTMYRKSARKAEKDGAVILAKVLEIGAVC